MTLSQFDCYMWILNVQWPGITACYLTCQVDYCCTSFAVGPTDFSPPFTILFITNIFYHSWFSVARGYNFTFLDLGSYHQSVSNIMFSGLGICLTIVVQATSTSCLELAHGMIQRCFPYHGQLPKVEELWVKLGCMSSLSAPNLYKCLRVSRKSGMLTALGLVAMVENGL